MNVFRNGTPEKSKSDKNFKKGEKKFKDDIVGSLPFFLKDIFS